MFVANFFDIDALKNLEDIPFDFIVGNPPWSYKKGLHTEWAKNKGHSQYLQNNDTCSSFILRSQDFCVKNSQCQCCFVLHSKMLYRQKGPSKKFRTFLLENTKISRIVEMSSVRKLVFKHATAPAVILTYSFSNINSAKNRFEYISMKPNLFFKLFDVVVVEKTDVKYVKQGLLLEYDWAWKTLVYGLSGDIDTIVKLKSMHTTLDKYIGLQNPPMMSGTGVKYADGDKKDATHLLGRPLLDSKKAIDHFVLLENNTKPFAKKQVDRPRDSELFVAPYCLVMLGLNTSNFTMRAVYSEDDFVFKSSVYAIKGTKEQKDILLNVTGLLNSRLYAYLNLMLGSSLGIEREQGHFDETLSFPFMYSESIVKQVETIQQLLKQSGDFVPHQDSTSDIAKLNEIIFESFDLAENQFIDYALKIQIPLLAGVKNCESFRIANNQDLIQYAQPLVEALSTIFGMSGKFVAVKIYPSISKYYCAVEFTVQSDEPLCEAEEADDQTSLQSALEKFSVHKINNLFYELRDVIYFESDSFFIIKPNYYKNWHPAIAQLDLAEVIDQILSRNGGDR